MNTDEQHDEQDLDHESSSFLASGRHPVNIAHLVMGVALAGLTVVWALVVSDVVEGDDIRWLLPVPWVLAGGAGLVGLIAADRRRAGARQQGWATGPTDTGDTA